MKKAMICAVLLISLAPRAFASEDQITCIMEGQVFKIAAMARDEGLSPTQALAQTSGYEKLQHGSVAPLFVKKAINLVFFDGGFAGAGGNALAQQMTEACMYPNGRYQPLK